MQEEMQALMCELEHSKRRVGEAAAAAGEARCDAAASDDTVHRLEGELQLAK